MSDDGVEVPDDLEIRVGDGTGNEQYRTCQECGRDCVPEPFDAGTGDGIRVVFSCPEHGVHAVVDPFEHLR